MSGVVMKDLIVDPAEFDVNRVVADIEEIRRYNPQRFEMEQLSAIVFEDPVNRRCAGIKDVTANEFWVRGHMPGMPLMPGVIVLEAAAQLCSYFTQKYDLLGGAKMVGLGGFEDVRFREPIRIGDRLFIACEQVKLRPGAVIISRFQVFVKGSLVAAGAMKGIPLPVDSLSRLGGQ